MKRVIAVLMVIVLAVTLIGTALAETSRKDVAESMIGLTKLVMGELLEEYKKNGTLTDPEIDMAYSYFKVFIAEKRVLGVEGMYPASAYLATKLDGYTFLEDSIDEGWKNVLDGKVKKEEFTELLFVFIKSYLDR